MIPQPMEARPVTLSGRVVRLEPLTMDHLPDLAKAARYDDVWTFLDEPVPESEQPVAAMIREALIEQERGDPPSVRRRRACFRQNDRHDQLHRHHADSPRR